MIGTDAALAASAYSFDYSHPSANQSTPEEWRHFVGAVRNVHLGIVHQTMGGPLSDIRTLTVKGGQNGKSVSAHYLILPDVGTTRTILCLVRPENVAWHGATDHLDQLDGPYRKLWGWSNENTHSIGVEISQPFNRAINSDQLDACAWLFAYLNKVFPALIIDDLHIVGHYMISRQKQDPQVHVPTGLSWLWSNFFSTARAYRYAMGIPSPNPNPAPVPAPDPNADRPLMVLQTGYSVQHGFKKLYLDSGLAVSGYPIGTEYSVLVPELGHAVIRQLFENGEMEWWDGTDPHWSALGRRYQALADKAGIPSGKQ